MSITQKIIEKVNDKILVEKAKRGNKESFGKLYMKYMDSIYRYVYFRLNCDRFEAEDATETVFLKAWDSITGTDFKNDNFRAFLYRIAHNHVIDKYRADKKTVLLTDGHKSEENLEDDYFRKSSEIELKDKVNKLPDDQKQVIILKFVEGMKNEEIAKLLDKTNEAVRALQYRALSKLKKEVKNGK